MIESVEVLKDAASAAIYGAAAGNGVILITTKSGASKNGTSSIAYDATFSNQSLAKLPEIFRAADFIEYKKMSGLPIESQLKTNGYDGTDTDWFDEVFDPSWSQQHGVTFQGGNNQGHFFTSINYVNNDGIVKGEKDVYKRLTAQINADYNIKEWFQIGTNNSIESWSIKSVSQMSQYGSLMNSVLTIDLNTVYYSSPDEFAQSMKTLINRKNILKNPEMILLCTSKYIMDDSVNLYSKDRTDFRIKVIHLWCVYGNLKRLKTCYHFRFGYRVHKTPYSYEYTILCYCSAKLKTTNLANANTSYYYQ
jgi:TonB-dependent SusC/RagA subfamily outer membrane receptor